MTTVEKSSDEPGLEFFLKARESFVRLALRYADVEELRSRAEFLSRSFPGAGYLGTQLRGAPFCEFAVLSEHPEVAKALGVRVTSPSELADARVLSAFEPPAELRLELDEQGAQSNVLRELSQNAFVMRYGFFESELDIIESALLGYRGIVFFALRLDVYLLQYLTELCRDFKMSCVLVAESEESLDRILQTDCPYIGLWGRNPGDWQLRWDIFESLASRIPSNCYSFAFAPQLTAVQKQRLADLKFCGVF